MTPKQAVFLLAQVSGLNAAVRRSPWRTARLAILCYHGVSLADEHLALPELYVTAAHLRGRFGELRRGGYTVLPLGEALVRLAAGTLPPRSVSLTFDDGTRDFAIRAAPLLEEFGFPATVYVTTYYADHGGPVFNTAMRYLLWRGRGSGIDLSDVLKAPVRLSEPQPPAWGPLLDQIDRLQPSAADKQAMLATTAQRIGVDFDAFLAQGQFAIMTPAQLAALPSPLIDVQLHTHRHRAPRDLSLFEREIEDNRASLTRSVGPRSWTHFCYPSGDYSARFLSRLRALGITSATTCVPGLASAAADPLLLPRIIDTSFTPDVTFRASIDGIAALLPRRRSYRLDADRA